MWSDRPTNEAVKERILDFFDRLPRDTDAAFSLVDEEPHKGLSVAQTREAILKGLWEDLEDWWEELDDPAFTGPWRQRVMPLREVQGGTLGWDVSGAPGEQVALVNIHCFDGEPTDDTAQFSVNKVAGGYTLLLDQIHVM